jgi:lipopolysaccharide export system permease protein
MFPKTLFSYLIRTYLARFGVTLGIISFGLILANIFDTLNRLRAVSFSLPIFLQLITFKSPYLMVEILPLIAFIATLAFFEYLIRSNELITIFNAGFSIWKILTPVLMLVVVIGIVSTTIIQPISSILIESHERLEAKLSKKNSDATLLVNKGVMVAEHYGAERRFITAEAVDIKNYSLSKITILLTDENNLFVNRIDAEKAIIEHNEIKLFKANIFGHEITPIMHDNFTLPTNLTINRFTANLRPPEYIAFWQLPDKIQKMYDTGMPTTKYRLYYYKHLFKTLMMASLVMLAACFTSKRQTRKQDNRKIFLAIAGGFTIYLFSEIIVSILTYNGLAPLFSTLLPILLLMFGSILVILHLHEIG